MEAWKVELFFVRLAPCLGTNRGKGEEFELVQEKSLHEKVMDICFGIELLYQVSTLLNSL